MLPQVIKFKGIALDLLFPQWCIGCGQEGNVFCSSCSESLPRIMPPLCPRCGIPQSNDTLCPGCARQTAAVDGLRSPFQFEGTIRQAVHQLKYNNLRTLALPLAELMREYLATNPLPIEVLVPVPLHRKRLKERGHNQSQLLAGELSKLATMPVINDALIRK
ncbi:ComF family protein [Chloroflexota bacterium]